MSATTTGKRSTVPNERVREAVLRAMRHGEVDSLEHLAALVGVEGSSLMRSLGLKDGFSHGRVRPPQTRMNYDLAGRVVIAIGLMPVDFEDIGL